MANFEPLIARLAEGKDWFVGELAAMPAEAATRPLAEDEWSLAQHVEHLIIVERATLMLWTRASEPMPKRTPVQHLKRRMVKSIMRRAIKVPVPTKEAEPSAQPDVSALIADWDKLRTKFAGRLDKAPAPDVVVFPHPVAGPLNALESLEFLADHMLYHQKRVRRLLEK